MTLSDLYIKVFQLLEGYINGCLAYFIKTPIILPSNTNLSVIFFGYTDLQAYLSFVFAIVVFVLFHYLIYRAFKWLIKFFGGVVYR